MKTARKKMRKPSNKKHSAARVREHVRRAYAYKPAFWQRKLTSAQAIQHVAKGLPFKEIETLRDQVDEPLESLGRHLSISRSTLQRRRADRRLTPQESDRVLRFCRLLRHAVSVFGDLDRARQWLKFPQRGLGGAVPLDYASSEVGAREVENLLGRIDYGVYS